MVEREIKLRFSTADEARARILSPAIGATPLHARRLQHDELFDTAGRDLAARRSALRMRTEEGRSLVTFKGAPQHGRMKMRDEHETAVADGDVLRTILGELGFEIWFRYEKYREEFAADDAVIAIDETPIGVFVEIEGAESRIDALAAALGRSHDDYVTDSYRALFEAYCRDHHDAGRDMVFP